MKLKTLKDIEEENNKLDLGNDRGVVGFNDALEKLRDEAINWYKHLAETGEDNVFDFLETFFDIKEGDLK